MPRHSARMNSGTESSKVTNSVHAIQLIASSPGPTFQVEPGSRNFNGNHESGCLHRAP